MTVSTFQQTQAATQSVLLHPLTVDGDLFVLARIAAAFAPHESSPIAMTVTLDAGHLVYAGQFVEKPAQTTAAIAAPVSNPRVDRLVLDRSTATVSIVAGAEAAAPVPPAIPLNAIPIAQILLTPTTTVITNAVITDERDFTAYPSANASTGGLLNVQTFGTAGTFTYTPTPGTSRIIVEVHGAGGSGGGCAAASGTTSSAGSGGGAGAYGRSLITSGFSGATVTIGTGGAPGAAGAIDGNDGSSSSFGAIVVAGGGKAGRGGFALVPPSARGGGVVSSMPTGANIVAAAGASGGVSFAISATVIAGGNGAVSYFGGGGIGAGPGAGGTAVSPGAGGGGAAANANNVAQSGGGGANGIVIVHEYA